MARSSSTIRYGHHSKKGKSPEMRIVNSVAAQILLCLVFGHRIFRDHASVSRTKLDLIKCITRWQWQIRLFVYVEKLKKHYCTTFKAIKESVRNGTDRNVGDSSYNNWGMIDRLQVDSSGWLKLKFNGGRRTESHPYGCKEKWIFVSSHGATRREFSIGFMPVPLQHIWAPIAIGAGPELGTISGGQI